jgi:hypothetical protein
MNLYLVCRIGSVLLAVLWLRRLVTDFSPSGFDPWSVHVRYVCWTEWRWDRFFCQYFSFPHVNIIRPVLHTHLHLYIALTNRTWSEAWKPSKKQFSFGNPGTLDRKVLSVFAFLTCRVSNGESLAFDCRSPGCGKVALVQVLF